MSLPQTSDTLDWKAFGREVGPCFNTVPPHVSFLSGPLEFDYQPKERKKPQRRTNDEDNAKAEKVGEVQQTTKPKDSDKLSAVEKHMKVISKTLKRKCAQTRETTIEELEQLHNCPIADMDKETRKQCGKKAKEAEAPCAVQFLFNPKSFTQTVENIFSLAFLVKRGSAQVGVRSVEQCEENGLSTCTPGPFVMQKTLPEGAPVPKPRQAIVALNMKDWKAMVETYNVEQGDIPHRTGSKHARPVTR